MYNDDDADDGSSRQSDKQAWILTGTRAKEQTNGVCTAHNVAHTAMSRHINILKH